jgi:hypothetical protein
LGASAARTLARLDTGVKDLPTTLS